MDEGEDQTAEGAELVDVVDELGTVQGPCDKVEAHRLGHMHPTVVSEVFDAAERWLLVRQASDRQDAGRWVSPVGGHVRSGESYAAALLRETDEELGLKCADAQQVGTYVYRREMPNGTVEKTTYVAFEQICDDLPVLNHESVEYRYFTETELQGLIATTPEIFGEAFHVICREIYAGRLLGRSSAGWASPAKRTR